MLRQPPSFLVDPDPIEAQPWASGTVRSRSGERLHRSPPSRRLCLTAGSATALRHAGHAPEMVVDLPPVWVQPAS